MILADTQTLSRQLSEELDVLYTKGDRTFQSAGTRVNALILLTNTKNRYRLCFPDTILSVLAAMPPVTGLPNSLLPVTGKTLY